jgi:exopolyphosphatase / guanosine-5'-triphosphate,3'-diphosphate pyrophosphatase
MRTRPKSRAGRGRAREPLFAAIDLGTHNCRLLIAARGGAGGFRVVDSFSRIVRLGEGLERTGALAASAIDRAVAALLVCAERIKRAGGARIRAVATEACRRAVNADLLLARARDEAGVDLVVLTPEEEAHLAAAGCAPLVGRRHEGALIFDIGGGSTEAIWMRRDGGVLGVVQAVSLPVGVMTLSERHAAPLNRAHYDSVRGEMLPLFADLRARMERTASFDAEKHHLLGTSGTVTTLAGIAMGLQRYIRARVDASWHACADLLRVGERVADLDTESRAAMACVGAQRADLMVPGCAIFSAIHATWPCAELRVADRGLREGILRELMAEAA